ncbi:MAG: maltose alpha-D-glucosyltransferase [Immundisolibacter sp.]|uniref:maltose alpha-D-glucosyltransferase n=1 Tax=Immundisolibacter sp. TaxID=1934948 RepID=UPI00199D7B19|nr:maltose alpha-D-glucosyltransferase [Immundisolibacter sp.]MBC7162622.1 maltose alpha-D-glucosyltransferase [Immundisolibacter sp.]
MVDNAPGKIGDPEAPANLAATGPQAALAAPWYQDAIVYQTHVKAFCDSTEDGIGDFEGLTAKLDYLVDLGVTALWLLPFYPSPLRDDGYDIADYRGVHPSYGTLKDFRRFLREAHRRGLKVITELVINHTSDQHPWFQRARRAPPGSAWRNYYVWSDTDQRYSGTRIIFTDTEASNWAWDPVAKAYYWHRFFSHQPDLNFDNPQVIREIKRIMKFWLDLGVDGMRLDAIPYLCERDGTNNENLPETHAVIRDLRAWLDAHFADRMFLGEANQWPEDVLPYFGDGDECHMAFHFPLMPRIYMALAQEDRFPVVDIMRQTPDIPAGCQWAIFLRNHDELTLEMVSDRERDYLWNFYAADRRARINLGIRRRLAPLLDNDRRKIELLNALLMSMPGTPILYYGDEIGMGDNVYLGDRNGVRTPMQWSPDRNGGFSRADPASLYLPPVMDPVYGFEAVNVEAQQRSPASLLNWMKRLIGVRKLHPALARGGFRMIFPGNRKVLVYLRELADETILCVANLSRAPQPVELDLAEFRGRVPVEIMGRSVFPPIGELPYFITVTGYGVYWFVLATETDAPRWHTSAPEPLPELATLVLPAGWASLAQGRALETLAGQVLPEFLPKQRWLGGGGGGALHATLRLRAPLPYDGDGAVVALWSVRGQGLQHDYALPLALAWETPDDEPLARLRGHVLARVRRGARVGVLYDAMQDPAFAVALTRAMQAGQAFAANDGAHLRTWATAALEEADFVPAADVHPMSVEQSNSSVRFGNRMVLKLIRRVRAGIHPEVEIGHFLTEVARFRNIPALLGAAEFVTADGQAATIAVLQRYVDNQGDGWAFTRNRLGRLLEDAELDAAVRSDQVAETLDPGYLRWAGVLGERLAALHTAFALPVDDPAFAPEAVSATDFQAWRAALATQAALAKEALARAAAAGTANGPAGLASALLARWKEVDAMGRLGRLTAHKTRTHGDLHLGQVLVASDDVYFMDFEGEPARDLAARRAKYPPLRDVAGMLRSFDYAARLTLGEALASRPQAQAMLTAAVEAWTRSVQRVFLDAYDSAAQDCPTVPSDAATRRALVRFFTLEKVLYELAYEANNRPQWLEVPAQGLLALLDGADA